MLFINQVSLLLFGIFISNKIYNYLLALFIRVYIYLLHVFY